MNIYKNIGRIILLITDNYRAHPPKIRNLEVAKLVFFPANVAFVLQPMKKDLVEDVLIVLEKNCHKNEINEIFIKLEAKKEKKEKRIQ